MTRTLRPDELIWVRCEMCRRWEVTVRRDELDRVWTAHEEECPANRCQNCGHRFLRP